MLQKILFCLLFLVFLHRFENIKIGVIDLIANASFAIYFIHAWLRLPLKDAMEYYNSEFSVTGLFIFALTLIFLSLLISITVKSIFGSRSRYVTGW